MNRGEDIAQESVYNSGEVIVCTRMEQNPQLATFDVNIERDGYECMKGWSKLSYSGTTLGKKTVQFFKPGVEIVVRKF